MEKVINLGIPHVGELIFENIDTDELVECLSVTQTWQILAENVLLKRWRGRTFEACKNGKTEVVEILLKHLENEEWNTKNQAGRTSFMVACEKGHKNIVKLLLDYSSERNIDLNARDEDGWTAFMWACGKEQTDVVKFLLDHSLERNIELNAKSTFGSTAFMLACRQGRKDVVKLLLDHSDRIEMNAKNEEGETAFMMACKKGQYDVVYLLLDHPDIDLNAREEYGRTAYMMACQEGHFNVAELLLFCCSELDDSETKIELKKWKTLMKLQKLFY